MSPLPGSPTGPLWEEMPITRTFLYITFRVPSKGAPPPSRFPSRAPIERDAPFPESSNNLWWKEPLIIYLSLKVLVNEPPSMFPNRVPTERDASSPEPMVYLFIHICQSPYLRSPPTKRGKTYSHHPRSRIYCYCNVWQHKPYNGQYWMWPWFVVC